MSKIVKYSNWCHFDRLNDVDLVDGERLRVTWPDGKREAIQVVVETSSYQISDHGHPYDVPVRRAFARVRYRGLDVLVRLVGLEAERV